MGRRARSEFRRKIVNGNDVGGGENGETLGDFCHRKGLEDLLAWTERYTSQSAEPSKRSVGFVI